MKINKEIIQRYHLGLCSPNEIAAVEDWLNSDQADMTFLQEPELKQLEKTGWEDLSSRFNLQSGPQIQEPLIHPKKRLFPFNWQIAASIIVLLTTGVYFLFHFKAENDSTKGSPLLAYKEISTKKGEKLQVILEDGTQVWMNSESTLRFPKQFTLNQRMVSFSGEAYFKVAKNPEKPFIINSKRTKVQVLGTRFNLRDYASETSSAVVVEEGKVRFSGLKGPEHLILTANQKGTYAESVKPLLSMQSVYSTTKYINWKDNKLVLDNLPLKEIVPILERWYGIELKVASPGLTKKRYTGSFENPTVHQVIQSITFALKSRYQQQGNTWIIRN
jgi:ferric-dicitrate binding protein FerR (iron transport regulator)